MAKEDVKKNGGTPPVTAAATSAATPPATASAAPLATTAMTPHPETQALEAFEYGEDAGQGFENQDMSDRKLPIIELLQSNSPEVVESKGKVYAGSFRNSVTGAVYDEIYFVPAITDHAWTEWIGRDDGGGFRGRHRKDAKVVADAVARNDGRAIGKLKVPQPPTKEGKPQPDHELVESFEIYAILYGAKDDEILGFAMIPFTSTKIKIYRAWNSAIGNFAPTINGKKLRTGQVPIFAHRVRMTSEMETKGTNTYMVPVLSPANGGDDLKNSLLPKSDPRYLEAKKLHDDVLAGLAKAAYESTKQETGADPEGPAPF